MARWRNRAFHSTSRASSAYYVVPTIDLAGEFTTFIVAHSLVSLRPRHLTSSFDMKL